MKDNDNYEKGDDDEDDGDDSFLAWASDYTQPEAWEELTEWSLPYQAPITFNQDMS